MTGLGKSQGSGKGPGISQGGHVARCLSIARQWGKAATRSLVTAFLGAFESCRRTGKCQGSRFLTTLDFANCYEFRGWFHGSGIGGLAVPGLWGCPSGGSRGDGQSYPSR